MVLDNYINIKMNGIASHFSAKKNSHKRTTIMIGYMAGQNTLWKGVDTQVKAWQQNAHSVKAWTPKLALETSLSIFYKITITSILD